MPLAPVQSRSSADRETADFRSLLHVVDGEGERAEAPPPSRHEARGTGTDFAALKELLVVARQTLGEERDKAAEFEERTGRLRAFEDAFFRHRETAEELRAECERWRRQALAVADRLLEQSSEPQPNGDAASGTSETGASETGASEASAVPEQPGLKQLLEVLLLTRDAINEQIEGASLLMTEAARRGEAEAACRSRRQAALQLRNKRELWKQRALLVAGWIKNAE